MYNLKYNLIIRKKKMKKRFIAGLLSLGLFAGCMATTSAFAEETVPVNENVEPMELYSTQIGSGYSRSEDNPIKIIGTLNTTNYRNQGCDEISLPIHFGYTFEELEEEGYKFINVQFEFKVNSSSCSSIHTLYIQNAKDSFIDLLDPLDFTLPSNDQHYKVKVYATIPVSRVNNQICLRYQLHAKQDYKWNIFSVNATCYAYEEEMGSEMGLISIEETYN